MCFGDEIRSSSVRMERSDLLEEESKVDAKSGLAGKGLQKGVRTLAGVAFGIVFVCGGFYVLAWGEVGTTAKRAHHLNDGSAKSGIPVTATGEIAFEAPAPLNLLKQGKFAVLRRVVQTCAWTEGSGDQKAYKKEWFDADQVPDHTRFSEPGHENKRGALKSYGPVFAKGLVLRGVNHGAVRLSAKKTEVTLLGLQSIDLAGSAIVGVSHRDEGWAYLTTGQLDHHCAVGGGARVGEQRVKFQGIRKGATVTVFGEKSPEGVNAYHGTLYISVGDRDALISGMKRAQGSKKWVFRGIGALLLWIGLYLVIRPLLGLVAWIPLIGGMVKSAARLVTMAAALLLTAGFVLLEWGMDTVMSVLGGLVG